MPDNDDLLNDIHREIGELHGTVKTMNETVVRQLARHETTLFGNGKHGVVTRVGLVEDKLGELRGSEASARNAKSSAKVSLGGTALTIVAIVVAVIANALGVRTDGQLPPPIPPRPHQRDNDKQEPQGNAQPEVDAMEHGDPRGKAVGAIGNATPPDGAKYVPILIVLTPPAA